MNPPRLPKASNHQQSNYSVCVLLQMFYLHVIGNTWKAHSLKSLSEYSPEQWKIGQDVAEVRWELKVQLNPKRRNSVDKNAGQVCCAQQPGAALPWDFLSLRQHQPGPVPAGDSAQQGVTAPEAWQPHCCGAQTCLLTSPSLLDTLNQPQWH